MYNFHQYMHSLAIKAFCRRFIRVADQKTNIMVYFYIVSQTDFMPRGTLQACEFRWLRLVYLLTCFNKFDVKLPVDIVIRSL